MRTIIAITKRDRITVYPDGCGGVTLETGADNAPLTLTQDQAGALLFAIERAAEASLIQLDRMAEHHAKRYPMGITA